MSLFRHILNLRKSDIVKSISVYTFIGFFSKGISFLLIPLFTNPRYLSPADNGVLSLFNSSMLLLAPFVSLGMTQSILSDYFKKSKEDFSNAFTTNFFISGFMALVVIIASFFFTDFLQAKYGFPRVLIFVMPLMVFLNFSSDQLIGILRNRNEIKLFAIVGIADILVEYILAVILIVFFIAGWKGRVWGIGVSLVVTNIFAFYYYFKNGYINFGIKKKYLWHEIKFGLPIVVFQLCVFAIGSSDKLILGAFNISKSAIGIYSIAYILGSTIGTVAQSILQYFQPVLYKHISEGESSRLDIRKNFIRYIKIMTIATIGIIGCILLLYKFIINKTYSAGVPYFFLIALTSYIWGINYYVFLFLLYEKHKRKIFTISAVSLVFTITCNIILIKYFSVWGAACGGLLGVIFFSLLTILSSKETIKNLLLFKS